MKFKADLHVHSCLSPCASLDMSPRAIVSRALEIGVNCLALTDHNSAGNCGAMQRLCERSGILFFPGLEVTTAEEAHVVCLFGEIGAAEELGRMVYGALPSFKNIPEKSGDQVLVNEDDEVEGFEEQYLGMACGLTVDELRERVSDLGGLLIAAHVDKPCFSVPSQLGFLSGEFSAVELSRAGALRAAPYRSDIQSPVVDVLIDDRAQRRTDITPRIGAHTAPPAADPRMDARPRPFAVGLSDTGITGEKLQKMVEDYAVVTASDSHYLHSLGSACVEFESDSASMDGFRRALIEKSVRMVIFDSAYRTAPGRADNATPSAV